MKKYLFLIGITIAFVLFACQKEEQVIVKKEASATATEDEPELVEQSDDDEVDELIEFILPDEKVMINLEMVPILNAYLHASQDRAKAVESMVLTPIQYNESYLYLLKFSCADKSCSYLLLNKKEGNQAYLVADIAQNNGIKLSQDHSKILLQFSRNVSNKMGTSTIVVVDIQKWELLSLTNSTNDLEVLNYQWPILDVNWIDNESIRVIIPEVREASSKQHSDENETPQKTQEIILSTD
ncbi:hypothetical protein VBD025_13420 [Virgibacillus flavescens]|uniref:hypothetical protein n=1 Tax=Virgibacillus flavescens TaxID=1611422 RepID=UPI003D32C21C